MQPQLSTAEIALSLMEKTFGQVTVQMKMTTCRLQHIGRGIWRLHVLCAKCLAVIHIKLELGDANTPV